MNYLIDELTSLINWQIEHSFTLSQELISNIVNLMVESRNLDDYYSDITFSYENRNDNMTYNCLNVLTVYYNRLRRSLNIPESQFFNNLEINLYPLIKLLFIIYHEVEHINQRKLWYNPKPTLESSIIKVSDLEIKPLLEKIAKAPVSKQEDYYHQIETFAKEYQRLYIKYYKFVPSERMANIRAYNFIQELLMSIPFFEDLIELYNYMNNCYYYSTFEAYQNCDSPTKYYLEQLKVNLSWWKPTLKSYNLTPDDKIYLGLELTLKEYEEVLARKSDFSLKLSA